MAIQATFTADITHLRTALGQGEVRIKSFETTLAATNRRLSTFGERFSGARVLRDAETMTRSIQAVGGAATLTDRSLRQVNATLAEASQAYQRTGRAAPPAVRALTAEVERLVSAQQKASETGAAMLRVTESRSGAIGQGLSAFAGGMGFGVGAGTGLAAATALGSAVRDLAAQGTQLTTLRQSFERISGGARQADAELLRMRQSTRGLVDDLTLVKTANRAAFLGVRDMGIDVAEAMGLAQSVSRAMGISAEEGVDRLLLSIAKTNASRLDELGIIISVGEANQWYAKQLNKSADALTDFEKRAGFGLLTIEKLRAKKQELGEAASSVTEELSRIGNGLGNLVVHLVSAGDKSRTLASTLGNVADALERIRSTPGPVSDTIARTLSSAGKKGLALAEHVETSAPWYLSSLATLGMAPTVGASLLARGIAPMIGDTSPFTMKMFPPIPAHGGPRTGGGGGGVQGPSPEDIAAAKRLAAEIGKLTGKTMIDDANRLAGHLERIAASGQTLPTDGVEALAKQLMAAKKAAEETGRSTDKIGAALNSLTIASKRLPFDMRYVGDYISMASGSTIATTARANSVLPFSSGTIRSTNPLSYTHLPSAMSPMRHAKKETKEWTDELNRTAQAFAQLAQVAGGSLDGVNRQLGMVVNSLNAAQELTLLGGAKWATSATGKSLTSSLASFGIGTSLGSMTSNGWFAGGMGAGSSLITAAALGAGPATMGVSAAVGGMSAIFAAGQNAKAQRAAMEQSRQAIIEHFGTLEQFETAVLRAGFSLDRFYLQFRSNDPKVFTGVVNQLNRVLAEQKTRAEALSKSLHAVAEGYGTLTPQLMAQIRILSHDDEGIADVVAFIDNQRQQGIEGVQLAAAALASRMTLTADELAALTKGIESEEDKLAAIERGLNDRARALSGSSGAGLQATAAAIAAVIGGAVADGQSLVSVLRDLGPSIESVLDIYKRAGKTPGDGFAQIAQYRKVVADPVGAAAVDVGQGLGQATRALFNQGLMTPGLWRELSAGIGEAWKQIEALGLGGETANAMLHESLQTLWEMIQANPELEKGLDDNTRAILDFALKSGQIGPPFVSAIDKMLQAVDRLIDQLEVFIARMAELAGISLPDLPGGDGAQDTGGSGGGEADTQHTGGSGGDYSGAGGGTLTVRPFARGGIVTRPTLGLVGESGPEMILPLDRLPSTQGDAGPYTINVHLDGQVIARSSVRHLPREWRVIGV